MGKGLKERLARKRKNHSCEQGRKDSLTCKMARLRRKMDKKVFQEGAGGSYHGNVYRGRVSRQRGGINIGGLLMPFLKVIGRTGGKAAMGLATDMFRRQNLKRSVIKRGKQALIETGNAMFNTLTTTRKAPRKKKKQGKTAAKKKKTANKGKKQTGGTMGRIQKTRYIHTNARSLNCFGE